MNGQRTRRNRIAWALGAKAVVALALTLPASVRRPAVEYRALAALPGLKPGAPVTLAGQLIGNVVSMRRRGDTTVLRVRFVRGAERLPGSRTVYLRRLGFEPEVTVLEMRVEARSERPPHSRSFALGGWLRVLPSGPGEGLFIDSRRPRRLVVPQPPSILQWRPPASPDPPLPPLART